MDAQPGKSSSDEARRKQELASTAAWVDANDASEKDFIILGDMNIQDCKELSNVTPTDFVSLNDDCTATNTATSGKPYDHVMYRLAYSTEVQRDLVIVDLVAAMKPYWTSTEPYPGDPYDHNALRVLYSDHNPIAFYLEIPESDDD